MTCPWRHGTDSLSHFNSEVPYNIITTCDLDRKKVIQINKSLLGLEAEIQRLVLLNVDTSEMLNVDIILKYIFDKTL